MCPLASALRLEGEGASNSALALSYLGTLFSFTASVKLFKVQVLANADTAGYDGQVSREYSYTVG